MVDKVNWGGLFPLNEGHTFFHLSGKGSSCNLPEYMAKQGESKDAFKEHIIKQVHWNWTLISQCIDSEIDAIELLKQIVTLWVTILGFSYTAMWREARTRETTKVAQRKPLHGLRKGLTHANE